MGYDDSFNQARWKATHNSYSGGERGSIRQQLDAGIRFVELDVNFASGAVAGPGAPTPSIADGFSIGHDSPGAQVYHGGGNPASNLLADWLGVVAAWSGENAGHTPIIVALDSKDNLTGKGVLDALDELLGTCFGGALYPVSELGSTWPTVDALRGRILVVLSGDKGTRLAYGKSGQIMFVEYQNNGDGDLKSAWFYAASADGDNGWALDAMKKGKIVRLWQFDEGNAKDGKAVSLPATDKPFSEWYLTYCVAKSCMDLGKEGSTLVFPPVDWSGSQRYDSGTTPSVAVSPTGTAVEVHKSQNEDTLWYRVGTVNPTSGKIDWGPSRKYDSGRDPSVAIDADNNAVEVHKSQNEDTLWYHVGTVDPDGKTVDWGPSRRYDSGRQPSVALNNDGVVVEVHKSQKEDTLWYHVGTLRPDDQAVDWGSSHKYDSGVTPSVAINDENQLVEVHQSQNATTLWYHVGTVDPSRKTIDMKASHRYDDGVRPSVAIDAGGLVLETHESQNKDNIYYHVGRINGTIIGWLDSYRYDAGLMPSAALLADGVTAEVHKSQNEDTLWCHVGQVRTYP